MNKLRAIISFLIVAAALSCGGCVERLIKVTSNPPGAAVWLNDHEIGTTPVSVPFTWYGEYSLTMRKHGYESIITSRETETPVYELPIFDFFSECIVPFTFKDHHEWHYDLAENSDVNKNKLIIRAERMKIQAQSKQNQE